MKNLIKAIESLGTFLKMIKNVDAPMKGEKIKEYTNKVKKLEEEIEKDFVDSCCEDYKDTLKKEWKRNYYQ